MLTDWLGRCKAKIILLFIALLLIFYLILYQQINETYKRFYLSRKHIVDSSDNKIVQLLKQQLEGLPWEFVKKNNLSQLQVNETCAHYPNLFELKFHNKYWQSYENGEIKMHIYGAYYDKRKILPYNAAVRILGFINQPHKVRLKNYCQIWFNEHTKPTIVSIISYDMLWTLSWDIPYMHLIPYIMTCIVPKSMQLLTPQAISIVSQPCEIATNNFKVIYEPLVFNETRGKFAICVKALSFPYTDLSSVLIEWLELMSLFGVEKVFLNTLQVHENISKVINYYEKKNFVASRQTTLAHFATGLKNSQHFGVSNFKKNRQYHEMIQYNDCFYRNLYKYDLIAIVDIDEIIMPLKPYHNWHELLNSTEKMPLDENCGDSFDAYCFRHTHYPLSAAPGIGNPPLQFLQHIKRHTKYSELLYYAKCWHNTSSVLAVHNHFPFHYIREQWCRTFLNTSAAHLQHYRYAVKDDQDLGELITDDNILRFSENLTIRSFHVFKELGFMPAKRFF